jgi:hypothetical protein
MELQEIDDRLKTMTKEIKDLEHKKGTDLYMEKLLQEQVKLMEKVCYTYTFILSL